MNDSAEAEPALPSLPGDVAKNVALRWPSVGPAWSAAVERELAELVAQLGGTAAVRLHSRASFVVTMETPSASVVVRSTPDPAGQAQVRAMEALSTLGVGPRVLDRWASDIGTWVVTDRVVPGSLALDASDEQLVAVLAPMAGQSEAAGELPPISAWLNERLTEGCEADLAPGAAPPTPEEQNQALGALAELVGGESTSVTHGDMSYGNILRAGDAGLRLIDPRGVAGDVEYDIAVLSFKTGRDTARLAKMVGADAARAEAWRTVAVAARV